MNIVVPKEQAIAEFEKWFESKKISGAKRAENSPEEMGGIEKEMIMAIQEGRLCVNEDNTLTLKLQFPLNIPNGSTLNELIFVHRIQTGTLQARTAHIKGSDLNSRLLFTIAAITNQEGGIIRALSDVDYSTASSIATYFF